LYPDLDLLRDAVATIIAYMFFNRGECGACALNGDIVVDDMFVTLLLQEEKGKKALRAGLRNVQHIPCSESTRFTALLRAFFAGEYSMEGRHGKHMRRWPLVPSEDTTLWSADTVSRWLIHACNAVQCLPPRVVAGRRTSSTKGLLPLPTPLVLA
jgi:hypothetical protein